MPIAEISSREDLDDQLIIISGDDLTAQPCQSHPIGGVFYRAGLRSQATANFEAMKGRAISWKQQRNQMIGEIAELAATKFYESLGFKVEPLSWQEFTSEFRESVVDLVIDKKTRSGRIHQRIQVKGSEFANRSIDKHYLDKCRFSQVSKVMFIAVKEVAEAGAPAFFVCRVMSEIQPHYIQRMWEDRGVNLCHPDNSETIKQWNMNKIF